MGRFGPLDNPERPPPAGLFARGYDRAATEELVDRLTARLQERTARLSTVERENRRLRAERAAQDHAARVSEVEDSIGVLTSAQEQADQTMAEADAYREQVADEAQRLRADARREADAILADARARAREVAERLATQAAEQQRAVQEQQELVRRQTAYLRSVRDTAGTQIVSFLDGLVDQVAAGFGAAHPAAVPSGASSEVGPAAPGPGLAPGVMTGPTRGPAGRRSGSRTGPRPRREPRTHVRHLAGR